MTKITFEKPDYKHWATLDSWGINAFALLINGICPTKYRAVRLAYLDIPAGFEKAKKTFTLLDSIPWAKRYEKLYISGKGGHPVIFIHEAINKNLPMPAMLRKAMEDRYKRYKSILPVLENQMPIIKKSDDVIKKQLLANRERRTYTKAVGLFVLIIKELKEKLSRNTDIKLSASQVAQLLIDKAENLNIEIDGLKSFDRKITEAIDFIQQETNTEISL
jgi:hypothetical protein